MAAHPPHRISASVSAPCGKCAIAGNFANVSMKRRSMTSFHRHTQSPDAVNGPRAAMADLPPSDSRVSHCLCGRKGTAASPRARRRKLRSNGGPCRTANTPAFSRGCSITLAQSPTPNTSSSPRICSVARAATNPCASHVRSVWRSHGGAPALVVTSAASHATTRPLASVTDVVLIATAASSSIKSMPAAISASRPCRRARALRVASNLPLPISVKVQRLVSNPAFGSSASSLWRIASTSSKPAAPVPITTNRRGPSGVNARASSSVQRGPNVDTGFTVSATSPAPAMPSSSGVIPASIDSRS